MNIDVINNRYTVVEAIGTGSMGEVYLCKDKLYHDKQVVIKIIQRRIFDKASLYRFKKEFDIMSRLKHPNLATVYDFGRDEDLDNYYISMEYINGPTLLACIEQCTPSDTEQVLHIFVDLLRACEYMHSKNILHRDIKPANIILQNERAKLMDFGLADLNEADTDFKGSLFYMAPEVVKNEIDHRADIFALGITMFEYLTGKIYYDMCSTMKIIKLSTFEKFFVEHKTALFNEFRDDDFSRQLKHIIDRMITFDPTKRYQSSTEIIEDINQRFNKHFLFETRAGRESYVLGANFVGRNKELEAIKEWAADDRTNYLHVYGEAGIGKSRLMHEFKKHCRLNGIIFIEGSFYQNITRMYSPFIAIIKECLLHAAPDPVKIYGPGLKNLLPDNNRLTNIKATKFETPKAEKKHIITCITDFLITHTANSNTKVIIYLNDLHWAESASLDVLQALVEKLLIMGKRATLKLVVTSREENGLPLLKSDHPALRKLKLSLFDKHNVACYINAVFGNNRTGSHLTAAIPEINKKVGGNPLFLQELIKSLVQEELIVRNKYTWDLSHAINTITIPAQIKSLILQRFEGLHLSNEEKYILEILSLINREIAWEELGQIISIDYDILLKLTRMEIVVTEEVEGQIVFRISHDLIIKTISDEIGDKKSQHTLIAEKLEMIHTDNPDEYIEEIAYHYFKGTQKTKAKKYLYLAITKMIEKFEQEKALKFYDNLITILDDDIPAKIDTLLKKGILAGETCKWDMAESTIKNAISLAHEINDKQRIAGANMELGASYSFGGKMKEANEIMFVALRHFKDIDDKRGISLALNSIGVNYFYLNDFKKAVEIHKKAITIARQLKSKELLARNTGNLGLIYLEVGNYKASLKTHKKSLHILLKMGKRQYTAVGNGYIGMSYAGLKKYNKAFHYLNISIEYAEKTGNTMMLGLLTNAKADLLYNLGRFDEARHYNDMALKYSADANINRYYFRAQILEAKLICALGDEKQALEKLLNLKEDYKENIKRVTIYFEIWKINNSKTYQEKALHIAKEFYKELPSIKYKEYIKELTRKK